MRAPGLRMAKIGLLRKTESKGIPRNRRIILKEERHNYTLCHTLVDYSKQDQMEGKCSTKKHMKINVFKKFGEWYQKKNKTDDTNKLTLLTHKLIAILHNTLLAMFIKVLETVSKGLFRNR
jgi:hypothetical protein